MGLNRKNSGNKRLSGGGFNNNLPGITTRGEFMKCWSRCGKKDILFGAEEGMEFANFLNGSLFGFLSNIKFSHIKVWWKMTLFTFG